VSAPKVFWSGAGAAMAEFQRQIGAINDALTEASIVVARFAGTIESPDATAHEANREWRAMWETLNEACRLQTDLCEAMLALESVCSTPEATP
jgi:hypothetical protein